MKGIYTILFLVFACSGYGQQLILNTTYFVGGDSSCGVTDARYAIKTADGGIVFTGITECWGGGDIPVNIPDTNLETSPGNVIVGKLDSNLHVSWIKVYGGKWRDVGTSIVQASDGGFGVLAVTNSNQGDVSGNHGSGDMRLLKIDSLGNLQWQKCYGSNYDDDAFTIAATQDNGFIMCGSSNGSGSDIPTHYSGSQFDYDWFVLKTDSVGNVEWAKSIGGQGDEEGQGSILPVSDGYYFVSYTNSTDYDCVDTAWHANVHTLYDYYVFKLDLAGNILWDSSYGGSGGDIVYRAIWDERDSSIVMSGLTGSNDYMVSGNHGYDDMWVVKIDKNGVLRWQKCLGGSHFETGCSITTIPGGYAVFGTTNPGDIGYIDTWAFVIDTAGNEQANVYFGGIKYEWAYCLVPFKEGFVALGQTNSQSFTTGNNIGNENGVGADAYFSYFNYFPAAVKEVTPGTQELIASPNPATGLVHISNKNGAAGTLTIINAVGQIIIQEQVSKGKQEMEIDTKDWAKGLYLLRWQDVNGGNASSKLLCE